MSSRTRQALIVGGGVIGLCSAWYLSRSGFRVTVLDRDASRREACSGENAGMIVPSHFTPLAAPGVIGQGLRWMLSRKSPLRIRPSLDPGFWRWCWRFFRHANARSVRASQPLLRDLSLESRRLFEELAEELGFRLVQRGLLMLCRTRAGLEEEVEVAERANAIGIEAEVCDPHRLRDLDPDVTMDAIGGVWFPQDCHLDPGEFLNALRRGISGGGGVFVDGEAIEFRRVGDRLEGVVTAAGETLTADWFVLAGGAWTPELTARLGLRLLMQAGKGYSMTLATPRRLPRLCSLLKEARVAVTPMGERLRVAGTMEICGNDLSVSASRLRGIIESFCRFFPEFEPEDFGGIEPWSGLRPCSPDGLPYLGRVPGIGNTIVATGHAMVGLSLGPVSGRLVAELAGGPPTNLEIGRLGLQR